MVPGIWCRSLTARIEFHRRASGTRRMAPPLFCVPDAEAEELRLRYVCGRALFRVRCNRTSIEVSHPVFTRGHSRW